MCIVVRSSQYGMSKESRMYFMYLSSRRLGSGLAFLQPVAAAGPTTSFERARARLSRSFRGMR